MLRDETTIINSALWAAYGDALGFITELADLGGLRARTGGLTNVSTTIPWVRRVGGKFGVSAELPAGCYSDDTQLRLATSRAMRSDKFDVEAFAKVELPVWLVYALGAGRGSKAAAASLTQSYRSWASNVYESKGVRYVDSGGNGAAMRIQPHVWSARDWAKPQTYLPDVVRNAITTHGHPTAIIGAAFHAMSLAYCLKHGRPSTPRDWAEFMYRMPVILDILVDDPEVRTLWFSLWEQQAHKSFEDSLIKAIRETERDIQAIGTILEAGRFSGRDEYDQIAHTVGAFDPTRRGSGTLTALLANVLVVISDGTNPDRMMRQAANLLGTDTDSIATMAGAMAGAFGRHEPEGPIADHEYLRIEAARMASLHAGEHTEEFPYPDLLRWSPPRAVLDYVGVDESRHLAIAGLGPIRRTGRAFETSPDSEFHWQWMELRFGQRILAKRRRALRRLSIALLPGEATRDRALARAHAAQTLAVRERTSAKPATGTQLLPLDDHAPPESQGEDAPFPKGVSLWLRRIQATAFDPTLIGQMVLELIETEEGRRTLGEVVFRLPHLERKPIAKGATKRVRKPKPSR